MLLCVNSIQKTREHQVLFDNILTDLRKNIEKPVENTGHSSVHSEECVEFTTLFASRS